MPFPSVLSTFNRPTPTDRLNSPSHSALHNTVSSALGQVEAVIGVDGANSVVGTLMYNVRSPGSNGGGHVQTANKGGTGQTTYAKGDMLVATSSSVLAKLALGANETFLQVDTNQATGVKWGAGLAVNVQSFASGGVWNKPSNLGVTSRVQVELWGGGGSGAQNHTTVELGGGGGGSYVMGWFSASILAIAESVAIGAGGAGVQATDGNPGGITTFGATASLLSAYGGGAGAQGSSGGGGGGGGGLIGSGAAAATSTGGNAGAPGSVWGGQGGSTNVAGGFGVHSGGGGGDGAAGGATLYGGGGGGGARSSTAGAGSTSKFGGGGGAGRVDANGSTGSVKGGGGGASYSATHTSGSGGGGFAVITAIP